MDLCSTFLVFRPLKALYTTYHSHTHSYTHSHNLLEQFGVQYLAQGHFDMRTGHKFWAVHEHPHRGPRGPSWTWADDDIYVMRTLSDTLTWKVWIMLNNPEQSRVALHASRVRERVQLNNPKKQPFWQNTQHRVKMRDIPQIETNERAGELIDH